MAQWCWTAAAATVATGQPKNGPGRAAAFLLALWTALVVPVVKAAGGTQLYFDGVDDFIEVFPTFSPLQPWTVEAWVTPSERRRAERHCLFHLSAYSGDNVFTLEAQDYQWMLRYGTSELAVGPSPWGTTGDSSLGHYTTDKHHVAVTHEVLAGVPTNAMLRMYLNGSLVASAQWPLVELPDMAMGFTMGACYEATARGLVRTAAYGGLLDEVRYWTVVRTAAQVAASMNYYGTASLWPAAAMPNAAALEAQYPLDRLDTPDLMDSSGKGNNGLRGGLGVTREMPRYQELTVSQVTDVAPVAGDARSVQLLGQGGYLELREPLTESATVEFWVQMRELDVDQTLFSITHKGPGSLTGMPVVSLSYQNNEMLFHFCSVQPPFQGVRQLTMKVPALQNLDRQHVAITWQYLRSVRGRAVYNVSITRNCTELHTQVLEVQDSCVRFGQDDAMLAPPVFGQRFVSGAWGTELVASEFASMHISDIRTWRRSLPASELCLRVTKGGLLEATEPGLQAAFLVSASDETRTDATIANLIPSAPPAALRCAYKWLACPDLEASRGYVLRPSVFDLPAQPQRFITSAGRANGTDYLPTLELSMPVSDPDNYEDYDVTDRQRDEIFVKVTSLPAASCGTLYMNDNETNAVEVDQAINTTWLPLLFVPRRPNGVDLDQVHCATMFRYFAVSGSGAQSTYGVDVHIHVKVPGPLPVSLELLDGDLTDNVLDAGDIILVRFDRTTNRQPEWRGLFDVVYGSLGDTVFNATWSTSGDALMLEVVSNFENLQMIPGDPRLVAPGRTRFNWLGRVTSPLQAAQNDSYPAFALSLPATGSFGTSYCSDGQVFTKSVARCVDCGQGNYLATDGRSCLPCAPGYFTARDRALFCAPCLAGSYMPAGNEDRSGCLPASPGFFVRDDAATMQVQCAAGMLGEGTGRTSCTRCPVGSDCETASYFRALAVPHPGHWRTETAAIVKCLIPDACLGGWSSNVSSGLIGDNLCEPGMGGPMCQGCIDGWWRPHDKPWALCQECSWTSGLRAVVVVAAEIIGVWYLSFLSLDAALWGDMHCVIVRLALNYFTGISLLTRLEAWDVRPAIGKDYSKIVANVFHYSLRFDGGVLAYLMSLECIFGRDDVVPGEESTHDLWSIRKAQTLFWALSPLVWLLGLTFLSVVLFECYTLFMRLTRTLRESRDAFRMRTLSKVDFDSMDQDDFIKASRVFLLFRSAATRCPFRDRVRLVVRDTLPLLTTAYFVLLPTMLRELVVTVACEHIGKDGQELRVRASPDTVCWEGEHVGWAIVALVAIFVWGLVVPAFATLEVYKHRYSMASDVFVKAHWGFISDGYEARFAFWEGVVHLRRLALILIGMWPDLTRASELALYQVVGVLALILHMSWKPFDNRVGGLLDTMEKISLCLFLLLVSATEFVILADPAGNESESDLVAVLFTGMVLTISLIMVLAKINSHETFWKIVATCTFITLLVLVRVERDTWMIVGFILIAVPYVFNVLFVCWVWMHLYVEMSKFLQEVYQRIVAPRQKARKLMERRLAAMASRSHHRRHYGRGQPMPLSMAQLKQLFEIKEPIWVKRLRQVLHFGNHESGAQIRFDRQSGDLVLGLHPDTYMKDTHLSGYSRRVLANLGPFLTDEERRYVGMSFRDALLHIIVECNYDRIHVGLLEFLVRAVFAWSYHRAELIGVEEKKLRRPSTTSTRTGDTRLQLEEATMGPRLTQRTMDESEAEAHRERFQELLFDDHVIFNAGLSARDFQAEMMQIIKMPKSTVTELLDFFFETKYRAPPRAVPLEESSPSPVPPVALMPPMEEDEEGAPAREDEGAPAPEEGAPPREGALPQEEAAAAAAAPAVEREKEEEEKKEEEEEAAPEVEEETPAARPG